MRSESVWSRKPIATASLRPTGRLVQRPLIEVASALRVKSRTRVRDKIPSSSPSTGNTPARPRDHLVGGRSFVSHPSASSRTPLVKATALVSCSVASPGGGNARGMRECGWLQVDVGVHSSAGIRW